MSTKPKELPKPWGFTQADIDSIEKNEVIWGTTRFLPSEDIIPKEFWKGNQYTRVVDAMFVGEPSPKGEVTFNTGFTFNDNFMRFLLAHLRSCEPQHEHKIAGIAYMVSKIVTIVPILT